MKLLLYFIISVGLFSQTGIPYYKNGVVTYVNPIGGIIVDTTRKQLRTAINGGLRGTPNQLWSVNANGDGEAIDVDWTVFTLLPPGSNGKRMLTLKEQPKLSVIPTIKRISDRELLVCPECTLNTPFVFRNHLSVVKVTKPCKFIIPDKVNTQGDIEIKAIYGYNFFASLDGIDSSLFPSTTPTGHCSSLNVSSTGQGINYPDDRYPWYIPIAKIKFDGSKFTTIENILTPFYTEDIRNGNGVSFFGSKDKVSFSINSWSMYNPPPTITTITLDSSHVSSNTISVDKRYLRKNLMWLYQEGKFRAKGIDYSISYDELYLRIVFQNHININIGDKVTFITID